MNKIRYHFDNLVSKGTGPLLALLTSVTLVFVLIVGSTAFFLRTDGAPYFETLWYTFNHVVDPGYLFGEGGETVPFLILMTLSTFWGVMVYSLIISFVAAALNKKIQLLQSGRSEVFAKNHIVILDYNESVPIMISELNEAYDSNERQVVVIFSDQNALDIHQHVRSIVPKKKQLKLLVRKGNIHLKKDLEKMHVDDAQSVIIASLNDVSTIKTLLALKQTRIFDASTPGHVVCLIREKKNIHTAKELGGEFIEVVYVAELKSKILSRSALHPGLSSIYKNIFSFVGEEIHFIEDKTFEGQSFKDLLLTLNHTAPIGLIKAGKAHINPPAETVYGAGDALITIAKTKNGYQFQAAPPVDASLWNKAPYKHTGRTILTIGYNTSTPYVIKDMESMAGDGSHLVMLLPSQASLQHFNESHTKFRFESITPHVDSTYSRSVLEALDLPRFDTIAIFANDDVTEEHPDSESLMTLLHIHNILVNAKERPSVVIEIEDAQNTEALAYVNVDDFLVSHTLISKIMTQIAENRFAHQVIKELINDTGQEFYLKRAEAYIKTATPLPLHMYKAAALAKKQVMVGYQPYQSEVILNPDFNEVITFGPKDRLVVIALEQ
jgi:Trk K+ transport system NAD-binding subunit